MINGLMNQTEGKIKKVKFGKIHQIVKKFFSKKKNVFKVFFF